MRFTIPLIILAMLVGCGREAEKDAPQINEAHDAVIATSIDLADRECLGQRLPIAIVLKNNNKLPTRSVSWYFTVNRVNHSDDIAGFDMSRMFNDPNRRTDRIIQPGESYKVCSSAPDINGYDMSSNELQFHVITDSR